MPAAQLKPMQARLPGVTTANTQHLEQRIADCDAKARAAAQAGDLAGSARLILQALDQERRLAGRGPQVLQLIKPRG
jgi:hypothetical protein